MEKETVSNEVVWSPSDKRVKSSQMHKFMQNINKKYNINLSSFSELHTWSIENKTQFWELIWDFFDIIGSKGTKPYIDPLNKMPGSKFFPNGKVNYAENMLSGNVSGTAIVFKSEDKIRKEISWKELQSQVEAFANFARRGMGRLSRIPRDRRRSDARQERPLRRDERSTRKLRDGRRCQDSLRGFRRSLQSILQKANSRNERQNV